MGDCRVTNVTDSVLVYERAFENEKLVCVVNFSNEKKQNIVSISESSIVFNLQENEAQTLNPYGAIVYETRNS